MVNGEITKVAYDGAEYVLDNTFSNAQKGDLLYSDKYVSFNGNTDPNAFYEIIRNTGNSVKYIDNRSENGFSTKATVVKLFRKIYAQTKPTIEERVTALEVDVATIKGNKAETIKRLTVGDKARVVGRKSAHSAEIGDIVTIVRDDEDRQPYKCELDGE